MRVEGERAPSPGEKMRYHCAPAVEVNRCCANPRTSLRAFLVAAATAGVLFATTGAGCRETARSSSPPPSDVTASPQCHRKTFARFHGANVIDISDASDEDPQNDGTRGFGSAASERTLDRLVANGMNAVLLPVVVTTPNAQATSVTLGPLGTRDQHRLTKMISLAHARGLGVILVPHLRLDDGQWRGRLAPQNPAQFFADYGRAINAVATIAEEQCVEGVSIGIEFASLTGVAEHAPRFRALIRDVRTRFGGEVVYSANWDEIATVQFWDAVDHLGVNAFFPLASAATDDEAALLARANEIVSALDAIGQATNKTWWVTEVGFKATPASYVEPWKWPAELLPAQNVFHDVDQERGYRAWTNALLASETIAGVWWWMIPSDLDDPNHPWAFESRQGFSFVDKRAEAVVKEFSRRWQSTATKTR